MNRLGEATSPYLLQHAENPVNWFQWGDEAFAEAGKTRRPNSPLGGLFVLPLVSRHGPRILRG